MGDGWNLKSSASGVRWRLLRAWDKLGPQLRRPSDRATQEGGETGADLIWMLGSPRSGSTWLMRLIASHPELVGIDETYLPSHVVPLAWGGEEGEYLEHNRRANEPSYFFATRYLDQLLPELRQLVVRQLARQASRMGATERTRWVLIKEPAGSHAAETILRITPDARLLFLLRDPRDVIDSHTDLRLAGDTWWTRLEGRQAARSTGPKARHRLIRTMCDIWLQRTDAVQRAFDGLPDERRLLVRYESLRESTAPELRAIYDWLGLEITDAKLNAIVERESFDAIPAARRGSGTPYRAATPGLWRQRFAEDEQALMNELLGPKLEELGYPL